MASLILLQGADSDSQKSAVRIATWLDEELIQWEEVAGWLSERDPVRRKETMATWEAEIDSGLRKRVSGEHAADLVVTAAQKRTSTRRRRKGA